MNLQQFEGIEGLERVRGYLALFEAIMQRKSADKVLGEFDMKPEKEPKLNKDRDDIKQLMNLQHDIEFSNKEERVAYMVKLKKKGMSYKDIGNFFDLSQRTIFVRIREYMKERGTWEDRDWKLTKGD